MHIEPYRIHVPDADLVDLRERLARTRFPDEIPGSGWGYGSNLGYVKELVAYWRDRYDWRAAEARLNQLPQFKATVGGLGIHLIHARGKGPKPMPLVITHGWPGSIVEFEQIIGPLTDPAKHGGDPADAFDVVCPSMPGYGFSDHPTEPGMDPERIAAIIVLRKSGARPRKPQDCSIHNVIALRRATRSSWLRGACQVRPMRPAKCGVSHVKTSRCDGSSCMS